MMVGPQHRGAFSNERSRPATPRLARRGLGAARERAYDRHSPETEHGGPRVLEAQPHCKGGPQSQSRLQKTAPPHRAQGTCRPPSV